MGGDNPSLSLRKRRKSFNPRLRVGGDARGKGLWTAQFVSFNPRLRVGGDFFGTDSTAGSSVSIHASAWEATSDGRRMVQTKLVSIHASAWEATCRKQTPSAWKWSFNPRLRVGGDADQSTRLTIELNVSIHASAWEATLKMEVHVFLATVSIHASAWEATPVALRSAHASSCFNPRLRVGGDR